MRPASERIFPLSKVLKEFQKITPNVVWDRGKRCWRLREKYNQTGFRMQE